MDESRQPDNNLPFSWITFIYDLVDVLGEECRSPEETLECFAHVLETYYPNFRMTVYYTEDEGDSAKSHLILQKGYSLPMDEFERMIDENEAFIKPYGLSLIHISTPNAKPKRKKPGSMRSYASLMSMSHSNT